MTVTRERLAIGAALVIIALTVAAFWLSYAHLHAVAASHGLGGSPARAWAWPGTIDLFIVSGELLMLRASLARKTDWPAIGLTVVGSTGSIALNVFGVGGNDLLAYVTAAVPPTAALLAFGALMRQVHSVLAEQAESETATATPPPVAVTASSRLATSSATTATRPRAASATPKAANPVGSELPVAQPASATTPAAASGTSVYLPEVTMPLASATPATPLAANAVPMPPATPAATANDDTRPTASPAPGTKTPSSSEQRDLAEIADTYRALRDRIGKAPSDQALADELGVGRSRAQQLRTAAIDAGHTDLAKPLRAAS